MLIGNKQSPLLPAVFHLNKAFFHKQKKKTKDTIQPVTMSDQGEGARKRKGGRHGETEKDKQGVREIERERKTERER